MTDLPVPVLERFDRFWLVRDDKIPGGTKQIILQSCLPDFGAKHFVYVASAFGKGGPALAFACAALGFKATLFLARGKTNPVWLDAVEKSGASIVWVDPTRVVKMEPWAEDYAYAHDAVYLPLGFAYNDFSHRLEEYAKKLPLDPAEIWCPIVSGTLASALEFAFPKAKLNGVTVVKHHDYKGKATLYDAPEKFVKGAAIPPSYPSWTYSDAKIWRFVKKHGINDAVIWNTNA